MFVLISQERWQKTKEIIAWMKKEINANGSLEYKTLESCRGYMVYISRTYPSIVPYLKGIHLTLGSWRPWRKDDGWKFSTKEIRAVLLAKGEELLDENLTNNLKPPNRVKPVGDLTRHLEYHYHHDFN